MREPILVTGATGFIGRHVARALLEDGLVVRVLVRDPARLTEDVRGRAQVRVGDMADRTRIAEAVRGTGTVIHLAALARAWSPDPDAFARANEVAVRDLLAACRDAGVARIVHVSTVLAAPPYREAPVHGPARELTPYELTKRRAEDLVREYVDCGGDAVIVRPTRVYGPGPLTDANGVTCALRLYLRGALRVRVDDGDVLANYGHVEDVAGGIVQAARLGRAGACYTVGGDNVCFREVLDMAAEISGVRHAVVALPPTAALGLGRLGECWGRMGHSTSLTRGWVRTFLEDRRVDQSRSVRELGYAWRPLRRGLAETIAWLRSGEKDEACAAAA